MRKNSIGKIIGGSVLALFLGLIGPMTLVAASPIIGVAATWLYAWAGIIPAAIFALVSASLTYMLGGGLFCFCYVLAVLVPACIALWLIRKKLDYKLCMRVSVIAQFGAIVLALGAAWMALRTNLVDMVMGAMGEMLKQLPSDMMDLLLMTYRDMDFFGEAASGIDSAKGFITRSERIVLIDEYVRTATEAFKIALAGGLLTSSVLTGVLNVAIPVWIWARRADDRGIQRLPVSEWYVPANVAIGLPVCALICYILAYMGYPGGDAAYFAVWGLFLLLLRFQCLGAISRAAKKGGASRLMRGVLFFGAMTFASGLAAMIGGFSLYVGSKGLITEWIRQRKKNQEGDQ